MFFIVFCFVGAVSAKYDDSFIRLILGDDYVNMTNENIRKGNPFGVYGHSDQLTMFLFIAYNNIQVSFIAFVGGIFFCILTVLLLAKNGLMLGSFEYYFFSKDLDFSLYWLSFCMVRLKYLPLSLQVARD